MKNIVHLHPTFIGNNHADHRPYVDLVAQPRPPHGRRLHLPAHDDEVAALLERDKRARARRVYAVGLFAAAVVTLCVICLFAYQAGEAARQAGL